MSEPQLLQLLLQLHTIAKGTPLIDGERPLAEKVRAKIEALVAAHLRTLAERVAAATGGQAEKAGGPPHDDAKDPEEVLDDEAAWRALREELVPHLEQVARDAGHYSLLQVGANVQATLGQVHTRAVKWAEERAAELVTQVSETTRQSVRDLVALAEEEGWSNDRLATMLTEDGVFDRARATMIARTETAFADTAGSLIGWQESGVVSGKEWSVGAGCCDACEELHGEVVGLDEEFPEGDPPLHPNCRCALLPVVREAEQEAA
jgi:SPP1 gp7 family putative phage head morphogenesis protein